jgi:hypothetical protein
MTVTINQDVIDQIKAELAAKIEIGANQGAELINGHISELTPVDTGLLRSQNSYEVEASEDSVIVRFFNETPYDIYVNYGTSRQEGKFYRETGIHEGLPEFVQAISDSVK